MINQPNSPEQIENALIELGLDVISISNSDIKFWFNCNIITYYYKKQYASGKGITDGHGWNNLLKQINPLK